jgi:hypothetical protein
VARDHRRQLVVAAAVEPEDLELTRKQVQVELA